SLKDAYHDSIEITAARAQYSVNSATDVGRLDIFRVTAAHRRVDARVVDAALHEADAAPLPQAVDGKLIPAEIECRQPRGIEHPLKREIVNREDRRRAAEQRMRGVERAQIDRREPRLPVMRVDDRRAGAAPPRELERRAREERAAPRVVRIIRGVRAVQRVAIV